MYASINKFGEIMALRTKSAIKKHHQSIKKRDRNRFVVSTLRGKIKNFQDALDEKDVEKSKSLLRDLISFIDKAATKGVIHKSNASRKISRYSKKVTDLAGELNNS